VILSVPPRDFYQRKGVIDSYALDRVAHRGHAQRPGDEDLVLDLSRAQFIDHDCLLLLAGIVADRQAQGLRTRLALPDNDGVLDFLRAWRFPEFLQLSLSPRQPVFTPHSMELLSRRDSVPRPRYVSFQWARDGSAAPVTLLRSLAIMPVSLSTDPWSDAAAASQRFLLRNFQAVLGRTIGKAAGSQIADVVWEAVLNASSHPGATLAATSSHFRPRLRESPEDPSVAVSATELQFSIWDNGAPIAATLRTALEDNHGIVSSVYGKEDVVFRVRVEQAPGGFEHLQLTDQDTAPFMDPSTQSSVLLTCAAYMLGVSSDPTNSARPKPVDGRAARLAGGTGLAIIRQAALDSNRGRLEYRSGALRLSARRAQGAPKSTYDFHVSIVPQHMWHIRGNLLHVTMPLRVPQ
jgi:hypothetical protein